MKKDICKMEFEEALEELERISNLMNEGNLPLKEAAKLYETGVQLKEHCSKILESIELKVQQISMKNDGSVDIIRRKDMEL